MTVPLLLIGCGNMGGALLARWAKTLHHEFSPIMVIEPNEITVPKNVSVVKQLSDVPADFKPEMIVLAVKPQQLDALFPKIAKRFGVKPTYLSIAAGKTIAYYQSHLKKGAKIVRAMPNTPAMIGEGFTGLVSNQPDDAAGSKQALKLMRAVGRARWVSKEGLMDIVTAMSGSGPAYFFYIIECMVEAGVKHGLSREGATELALQTCMGSAKLALASEEHVADLRKKVTSPGGTTEAAIKVLQKDDALKSLIEKAITAAIHRAREL